MRSIITTLNSSGILDKIGAAASWACAIHCLAVPFAISFLPLIGLSFIVGEGFEYVLIGISMTIGMASLLPGFFRQHGKLRTLLLFASGFGLVVFADQLFEESLPGKLAFVMAGAGLITYSHMTNRRLCRACRRCAG